MVGAFSSSTRRDEQTVLHCHLLLAILLQVASREPVRLQVQYPPSVDEALACHAQCLLHTTLLIVCGERGPRRGSGSGVEIVPVQTTRVVPPLLVDVVVKHAHVVAACGEDDALHEGARCSVSSKVRRCLTAMAVIGMVLFSPRGHIPHQTAQGEVGGDTAQVLADPHDWMREHTRTTTPLAINGRC